MRRTLMVVGVLSFLMTVTPCWAQSGTANGEITGTVSYRQRIPLPADATVRVQLEDISRQDVPAKVIAETSVATAGKQVPIPFDLKYDSALIVPANRYNLRASIFSGGQMLFATTSSNPVITQGAPARVDLVLDQVTAPGAATPDSLAKKSVALEGPYWKLIELNGKPAVKGLGSEAHLIMHSTDHRIAGSDGCNRISGTYQGGPVLRLNEATAEYEVSGTELHFTPAATTMIACGPALLKQEKAFVDALKATTACRIQEQNLELLSGDEVVARFHVKYLK